MAMLAPKCYWCSTDKEVRHYSTQCPVTASRDSVTPSRPKRPVISEPAPEPRDTVTDSVTPQHCPTCTCVARQVHKSNAARQAAYRERKAT